MHLRTQILKGCNSLRLTPDKVSPFTRNILNLHNFTGRFIQCHTHAENRKRGGMADYHQQVKMKKKI